MPHDSSSNRKKYGPAPEGSQEASAPEPPIGNHGFIRIWECDNCDGWHSAILDLDGRSAICSLLFDSQEEALLAAKTALVRMGHSVHVGEPFSPPEPELLN